MHKGKYYYRGFHNRCLRENREAVKRTNVMYKIVRAINEDEKPKRKEAPVSRGIFKPLYLGPMAPDIRAYERSYRRKEKKARRGNWFYPPYGIYSHSSTKAIKVYSEKSFRICQRNRWDDLPF